MTAAGLPSLFAQNLWFFTNDNLTTTQLQRRQKRPRHSSANQQEGYRLKSTRSCAVHAKDFLAILENFHIELASQPAHVKLQGVCVGGFGATQHGQKIKNAKNGLKMILAKFHHIELLPHLAKFTHTDIQTDSDNTCPIGRAGPRAKK